LIRIISGKYKGRSLKEPRKQQCRPTTDRAKEGLFSVINSRIPDSTVLDLCCGTGGLGLESLSRGAREATFVDLDTTWVKVNTQWVEEPFHIVRGPIDRFIKRCSQKYDLIFFDPPWDKTELYETALKAIIDFDILRPEGVILCEHKKYKEIEALGKFDIESIHTYGDTQFSVLKK
jgi:16S rRNA (guanine966-N2)-methyltransferase